MEKNVAVTPLFWVDGVATDVVPVSDRAFQYGDGLFETMRRADNRIPLLHLHWQRLTRSCQRLQLPFSENDTRRQLQRFIEFCRTQKRSEGIIKLTVTRGSGGRGYSSMGCAGRLVFAWFPAPSLPDANCDNSVEVMFCQTALGHSPALAGLKHLNRLEQVLARREVDACGYGEGLLLDSHGFVIEGTTSNLFLVESGTVVTPNLNLCGVEGVFRQWLLQECSTVGVAEIMTITRERLLLADEVFLGNSVMGVIPVSRCEDRIWESGSVTHRVRQEILRIFHVNN